MTSESPNDQDAGELGDQDAESQATNSDGTMSTAESNQSEQDEGPGWMPAILAATLLMGIFGFICCGVSTWRLFQKQTPLVIRTLEATYIPGIEQSLIEPEEKKATLNLLEQFVADLERGKYENWQAGGVMTRLVRLPVLQWGEVMSVQVFVEKHADKFPGELADDALVQLSRIRRAVETNRATSIDFEEVLKPALVADNNSEMGRSLIDPLTVAVVKEVIARAKLVADRSDVPEQMFDDVRIDKIVEREIKAGIQDGAR